MHGYNLTYFRLLTDRTFDSSGYSAEGTLISDSAGETCMTSP